MGTLRAGITGDIPFETAPVLDSAGEGNEGAPPADSEHHGGRWDSPWRKRQPTGRCCLPEPIHARWCCRSSKHAGRQVLRPITSAVRYSTLGMVGRRSRIASRTQAKLHLDFRLPCMRPPPASLSYHRAHLSAKARCVEIRWGIPFTVAPWRCATARSRDVQDGVRADDIDDDRFMGVGLVQIFYSSVEL
jgi:hypothetical protein